MTKSKSPPDPRPPLESAVVVRVREDACDVVRHDHLDTVRYATLFPSPRVQRVSPGHLVALWTAPDGSAVVVWRWYDAVVVGQEAGLIRMWEPSHGEVLARPRTAYRVHRVGNRAYLSAGLPGSDWWVAGAVRANPDDAEIELDQVERLYTERDLWRGVI